MNNPFLRQNDHAGSFLPQDYVQRKSELRANVICLTLFGVVMFGIVSAFFVTNRQWLQVRRERQAITVQYTQQAARIEQLKNLELQKSEMMAKAEVTTALIEKVPRSILMAELVTRMPDDVALLEVHLEGKRVREAPPRQAPQATGTRTGGNNQIRTLGARSGPQRQAASAPAPERVTAPRFDYTLKLVGVAQDNNLIADYHSALQACSFLERVELKHIRFITLDRVEFREFVIEAQLRRDADARSIEPIMDIRQAMDVSKSTPEESEQDKPEAPVTSVPDRGDK